MASQDRAATGHDDRQPAHGRRTFHPTAPLPQPRRREPHAGARRLPCYWTASQAA